jgi:hypothetical protein
MVMDSQQQQPERRPEVGFACTSQFMVADAKGICMAGNPHESKKADVRGCGMLRTKQENHPRQQVMVLCQPRFVLCQKRYIPLENATPWDEGLIKVAFRSAKGAQSPN